MESLEDASGIYARSIICAAFSNFLSDLCILRQIEAEIAPAGKHQHTYCSWLEHVMEVWLENFWRIVAAGLWAHWVYFSLGAQMPLKA